MLDGRVNLPIIIFAGACALVQDQSKRRSSDTDHYERITRAKLHVLGQGLPIPRDHSAAIHRPQECL